MSVKRYEFELYHCNGGEMLVSDAGDYVSHEDYAALEAKCAALAAELKQSQIDAGCYKHGMEASNSRLAQVAAENADLKHSMAVTLEHVSVTDTGQAGVAAMIINDALHHSETPATDAFLAEVRAQGVEMFAAVLRRKGDDAFFDAIAEAQANAADQFAARLRQEAAQ